MQEYILANRENLIREKEKKAIMMALRLASQARIKYGDGALDRLAEIIVEELTEEEVVKLIENLEKTK